jgi:hypothetical protein
MTKERLYLFDTTLSSPFARSRAASEHEQIREVRRTGFGQVGHD